MLSNPRVYTLPDTLTNARHRIALASGIALLVAGLVLVFFVLPAEFAVDPFGVGARTGLLDLGVTGQHVAALDAAASQGGAAGETPIIAPDEKTVRHESVTFSLRPREGMEYKYRLAKGQVLLFTWTASVPVNYEAHAEPDGAPRGYAQTYEKGTARQSASGTLTAPFSGIHGWFWENTTDQPATVTLEASGFYTLSHEFRAEEAVKTKTFR
ncbi:MAG: hypothetical protein FJW27_13825 [Acidimicrobiia bacterium]|nr:hypothetical protein [Acidimicrobiia bacterium]